MRITTLTKRHEVSKCCWENGANWLAQHRAAPNLGFVRHTVSVKHNKVTCNKMRSDCVLLHIPKFCSRRGAEVKPSFCVAYSGSTCVWFLWTCSSHTSDLRRFWLQSPSSGTFNQLGCLWTRWQNWGLCHSRTKWEGGIGKRQIWELLVGLSFRL